MAPSQAPPAATNRYPVLYSSVVSSGFGDLDQRELLSKFNKWTVCVHVDDFSVGNLPNLSQALQLEHIG